MGGRFQNSRPRLRESSSPHHLTRPGLNNAPQRSPRGQLFQNRLECSEPTPGARGTWGPRAGPYKSSWRPACTCLPVRSPATRCRHPSTSQVQRESYSPDGTQLSSSVGDCTFRSLVVLHARYVHAVLLSLAFFFLWSSTSLPSSASCRCSFTNLFPFRFAEASV